MSEFPFTVVYEGGPWDGASFRTKRPPPEREVIGTETLAHRSEKDTGPATYRLVGVRAWPTSKASDATTFVLAYEGAA